MAGTMQHPGSSHIEYNGGVAKRGKCRPVINETAQNGFMRRSRVRVAKMKCGGDVEGFSGCHPGNQCDVRAVKEFVLPERAAFEAQFLAQEAGAAYQKYGQNYCKPHDPALFPPRPAPDEMAGLMEFFEIA